MAILLFAFLLFSLLFLFSFPVFVFIRWPCIATRFNDNDHPVLKSPFPLLFIMAISKKESSIPRSSVSSVLGSCQSKFIWITVYRVISLQCNSVNIESLREHRTIFAYAWLRGVNSEQYRNLLLSLLNLSWFGYGVTFEIIFVLASNLMT